MKKFSKNKKKFLKVVNRLALLVLKSIVVINEQEEM